MKPGDRVKHVKYGEGTVEYVTNGRPAQVLFDGPRIYTHETLASCEPLAVSVKPLSTVLHGGFTFAEAFTKLRDSIHSDGVVRLARAQWRDSRPDEPLPWVTLWFEGTYSDGMALFDAAPALRDYAQSARSGSADVASSFVLRRRDGSLEWGWRPSPDDVYARDWFIVVQEER